MKLIKQETPHGCGIACIAMVVGCSYQEAADLLGRDVEIKYEDLTGNFLGVTSLEMQLILHKHKIPCLTGTQKKPMEQMKIIG